MPLQIRVASGMLWILLKGISRKLPWGPHSKHLLLLPLTPYLGMQMVVTRTPAIILDHEAALGQKPHARMEQQEDKKNQGPDDMVELPDKPRLLISGLLVHEEKKLITYMSYCYFLPMLLIANEIHFFIFTSPPPQQAFTLEEHCSRSALKMQRAELSPTPSD